MALAVLLQGLQPQHSQVMPLLSLPKTKAQVLPLSFIPPPTSLTPPPLTPDQDFPGIMPPSSPADCPPDPGQCGTGADSGVQEQKVEWQRELLSPAWGKSLPQAARKAAGPRHPLPCSLQMLKIKLKSRMLFSHLLRGVKEKKKSSHCSCSKTLLTKRIIYCDHLVPCPNTSH